jgi:hypothetical protein
MLRQFYGALQSRPGRGDVKVMVRDPGTAQAQLASVYEHPEILDLQLLEVYLDPSRIAPIDGSWLRVSPRRTKSRPDRRGCSRTPHLPDSVTGAVGRRRHGIRQARVARLTARQPGWTAQVTTVPHAKFFWPEEHPRLLTVLVKEFWASAN